MKKTTKTLLSLLVIASLTAASVANALYTAQYARGKNLAGFINDFEFMAKSHSLWSDNANAVRATTEHILGKNGTNGVHFAKNGYLIERPTAYDEATVDKNIASVAAFANTGLYNVTLAIIPSSFEILRSYLPDNAYNDRDARIYERLHISFDGTKVSLCDARSALERHSDEYIYYRTDPHLTSLGSYYVYSESGESLGFGANRINDFDREIVTKKFRGNIFDSAASLLAKRDTIEKFILPGSTDQTLKYDGAFLDTIYEDRSDYLIFPGGNHRLAVINSNCGSDKKLAVIRDSSANSIAPFLANHYESVHLIDPGSYNGDLSQYLADNEITDVLIIYSSENFNTNTSLSKLG